MKSFVAHLALALLPLSARAAQLHLGRQDGNNGIHLAVSPICASFSGNSSDGNAGVDLKTIKTIVAFGVRDGAETRTVSLDSS